MMSLIAQIRLFTRRHKEPYLQYRSILGFTPRTISYYEQALLHRSSSIKGETGQMLNNERLEFLGDAILDAVVADLLYRKFGHCKEGFLTNTRSKIVQREQLNRLAVCVGIDKLVVYSKRPNTHNSYMYGNALEAFIGAIYLDRGYDVCQSFIENKLISPYIDLDKIANKEVNFKSKLIEWGQKQKVQLEFQLLDSTTDEHSNLLFLAQVVVQGIPSGVGSGYSKKEAHQSAAKTTLAKIKNDKQFLITIQAAKEQSEPLSLPAIENSL